MIIYYNNTTCHMLWHQRKKTFVTCSLKVFLILLRSHFLITPLLFVAHVLSHISLICLIYRVSGTLTPALHNSEESANEAACMNILWSCNKHILQSVLSVGRFCYVKRKNLVIKILNVCSSDVPFLFYQADSKVSGVWNSSAMLEGVLFFWFGCSSFTNHGHIESFRLPGAPEKDPSERLYDCSIQCGLWAVSSLSLSFRICWGFFFFFFWFSYIQNYSLHESSVCVRAIFPLGSERSWAVGLWGCVWIGSQWHLIHCFCNTLAPSSGKILKIDDDWTTARSLKVEDRKSFKVFSSSWCHILV